MGELRNVGWSIPASAVARRQPDTSEQRENQARDLQRPPDTLCGGRRHLHRFEGNIAGDDSIVLTWARQLHGGDAGGAAIGGGGRFLHRL